MSIVSCSTTTTTAYKVTADTTGTLVLQTGSTPTTAVTIDGSQNVGVGTATMVTGAKVTVSGSVAASAGASVAGNAWGVLPYTASSLVVDTNAGTSRLFSIGPDASTKGAILFYQSTSSGSATQAMTLDASGNLLVGRTSLLTFSEKLTVEGAIGVNTNPIRLYNAGTYYAGIGSASWAFGGGASATDMAVLSGNNLLFGANGAEKARIDTNGNLLVGTTTSAYTNQFTVASGTGNGKFVMALYNNDTTQPRGLFYQAANTNGDYAIYFGVSGTAKFYVNGSGNVYGTGAYNQISDASLKTNVQPLETGLAEVLNLQPRRFDWIDGSKSNVAGFIAQEVEQVIPDLVVDWKKGAESEEIYKAVSVTDLIPTLVKAIQEQQAIIETLTTRITALEAK